MSRSDNVVRNLVWGFSQKTISLLLPFLTRTVLLKVLGADYLGLNSLFISVLNIMSLAELGVSDAIISTMYKPIATGDTKTICALMNFYKKIYRIIGCAIFVMGLCATSFIDKLIKGTPPPDVNIRILFLVYLFNTSVSYFLFAYKNCLFIAHQRNDVISKIGTMLLLIQNLVQIILLFAFKNYYCYVIVLPLISVLSNILTALLANRIFPQYSGCGELHEKEKQEIKKKTLGLLLARVSATIRSSIDSIFISAFLGLTVVAMYSNYFYVCTSVAGIIRIIETSLIASVGNSIVTENIEKNYNDFNKFTYILQWIVGWCSICILCLIQPFMRLWVGEKLMFNDTMAVLTAIYLFVSCICLIRSIYTQALGMWWNLRYISIFDIMINTILNLLMIKLWGAYGILTATITDIVIVSIPWTTFCLFRDYFGTKYYKNYMFRYFRFFVFASAVGILTYFTCGLINYSDLRLEIGGKLIVCILVPNIFYYLRCKDEICIKELVKLLIRR